MKIISAILESFGYRIKSTQRPFTRWGLEEGLEFVRELGDGVHDQGWGVGMTGSVLLEGESGDDLDVIVYPLDASKHPDKDLVRGVLVAMGCRMLFTCAAVQRHWRGKGSTDIKFVEKWAYKRDGRRQMVDVFFLS